MSRIALAQNYVQRDGSQIIANPTTCAVSNGTKTTSATMVKNAAASVVSAPTTASSNITGNFDTPAVLGQGSTITLVFYLEHGNDANADPTGLPYINVHLRNTGSANLYDKAFSFPLAGYHLKWNQWNYITLYTGETGAWNAVGTGSDTWVNNGAASWDVAMSSFGLICGGMDGKGIKVYMDSIVLNQRSRPKIIFGFDAISTNLTNSILPLITSNNIPCFATFNLAGGAPTSLPQAQAWAAAGVEIVNHGKTHTTVGTMATDAAIITEVEDNWNAMVANGLVAPGQVKAWIGPENSNSPRANRVLEALGYKVGRNYRNFVTSPTKNGVDNLLDMGSFGLGNPTSLTRLKNMLDAPLRYGGTAWYFAHEVNVTTPATGPTGSVNTIYIDDLTALINKMVSMRAAGLCDLETPTSFYKGLTQPRVVA